MTIHNKRQIYLIYLHETGFTGDRIYMIRCIVAPHISVAALSRSTTAGYHFAEMAVRTYDLFKTTEAVL